MNPQGTLWYRFVRWFLRNIGFRATGGFRVVGAEHVPLEGAVVIAANHMSHLDPPAVACALPRSICFMGKDELFRVPLFGPLIRSLNAFPIRRGTGDTESIRRAIHFLEAGQAVLVFPEGTRSDGTQLLPFTSGIAMLSKRGHALVLPVAVIGTHRALPKGATRLKRHPIVIAFGPTLSYQALAEEHGDKQAKSILMERLTKTVAELAEQNGMPLRIVPSTTAEASSPADETANAPKSP